VELAGWTLDGMSTEPRREGAGSGVSRTHLGCFSVWGAGECSQVADATHWATVHADLATFKSNVIAPPQRMVAPLDPAAQAEVMDEGFQSTFMLKPGALNSDSRFGSAKPSHLCVPKPLSPDREAGVPSRSTLVEVLVDPDLFLATRQRDWHTLSLVPGVEKA
jgi:hypothetical protein